MKKVRDEDSRRPVNHLSSFIYPSIQFGRFCTEKFLRTSKCRNHLWPWSIRMRPPIWMHLVPTWCQQAKSLIDFGDLRIGPDKRSCIV